MDIIYIGSSADKLRAVPLPESVGVSVSDVSGVTRAVSGRAIIARPRPPLRALAVMWRDLSPEEAREILEIISRGSFFMRYPDPVEGGERTSEFYCSRREAKFSFVTGGAPALESLSVRAEEV